MAARKVIGIRKENQCSLSYIAIGLLLYTASRVSVKHIYIEKMPFGDWFYYDLHMTV
jgi:hypothetical protein